MPVTAITGSKPAAGPSPLETPGRVQQLETRLASVDAKLRGAATGWTPEARTQRKQLQTERASLSAELSRLRGGPAQALPAAPKVDPKLVTESRILTQLRSLPAPYHGDSNPSRLGRELFERTQGRIGTDEPFVFHALELAHTRGEVSQLNAALGEKMRAADPGMARRPEVTAHPDDGYLRVMIKNELSGSEAQRATDFLETGHDRFGSSAGAYVAEGIGKTLDNLGDRLHDQPVKTAAMIAGTVAVGIAVTAAAPMAPVVVAAATVGMLGYSAGKVVKNGYEAATAKTAAERAENLVELGGALADTAMSSIGAGSAVKTLSAAAKAAAGAHTAGDAAIEFLSYGSKLKGAQVATAVAAKPPKPIDAIEVRMEQLAGEAARKPTLGTKLTRALGVDVSDVKVRAGGKVEFSAGGQRYLAGTVRDRVTVEQMQNGMLVGDPTSRAMAQRLAADAAAKAELVATPAFGASPLGQKLASSLGAEVSNVKVRPSGQIEFSAGADRFIASNYNGGVCIEQLGDGVVSSNQATGMLQMRINAAAFKGS